MNIDGIITMDSAPLMGIGDLIKLCATVTKKKGKTI